LRLGKGGHRHCGGGNQGAEHFPRNEFAAEIFTFGKANPAENSCWALHE
jgi:hypothetical protein